MGAIAVVRCDVISGKISKVYENIKLMSMEEDISIATAYYRTSDRAEPMNGERYMFENKYLGKFPETGPAMLEKAKEQRGMTGKADNCDNELELLGKPAPKEKKAAKKPAKKETKKEIKATPAEAKGEYEPPKPQPVSDLVNHPSHYCTGEIECWDAMISAFGAEWMMAYANIAAFKYVWRAKHKGKFAEDMRKAAWYNERAAELKERIDGERREGTEG